MEKGRRKFWRYTVYIEQATTFDEARRPTSARILCNLRCIGPRRRVAHFTFRAYLATKHGPPTVRTSFPILIPFAKFLSKYRNSDAFLHFLHDKISFCRQFYPFTGKIIVANFYIVKFLSRKERTRPFHLQGFSSWGWSLDPFYLLGKISRQRGLRIVDSKNFS